MKFDKFYAGIGSRETPPAILELMEQIAYRLALGWNLRSGGAPGADQAFYRGAIQGGGGHATQLYLPWPSFERASRADETGVESWSPQPEAFPIAARFHPAWDRLSQAVRKLHARNVHQILGPDVTAPVLSRFVICWTKDGQGNGGTGQALRIAKHYGVHIFDLGSPVVEGRLREWLAEETEVTA